jgi:hypothetical protein
MQYDKEELTQELLFLVNNYEIRHLEYGEDEEGYFVQARMWNKRDEDDFGNSIPYYNDTMIWRSDMGIWISAPRKVLAGFDQLATNVINYDDIDFMKYIPSSLIHNTFFQSALIP